MNKKGFTLVELLGVIIILILLTFISSRAIMKTIKSSKSELSDTQKENIKSAVYFWIEDNMLSSLLPTQTGSANCRNNLSLSTFSGYLNTNTLSNDIINSNEITIKICKNNSDNVSYSVEIEEN